MITIFAHTNKVTGEINDFSTRPGTLSCYPLDDEDLIFLDVLQKYAPDHKPSIADVKWYGELREFRGSRGWDIRL